MQTSANYISVGLLKNLQTSGTVKLRSLTMFHFTCMDMACGSNEFGNCELDIAIELVILTSIDDPRLDGFGSVPHLQADDGSRCRFRTTSKWGEKCSYGHFESFIASELGVSLDEAELTGQKRSRYNTELLRQGNLAFGLSSQWRGDRRRLLYDSVQRICNQWVRDT